MKSLEQMMDEYIENKLREINEAVENRDEYETPKDIVGRKVREIVEELWNQNNE